MISKEQVAFYLADAYERTGDYAIASKVYIAGAAANSTNVGMHLRLNPAMQSYSNWASYRYAWLTLTSPDEKVRSSYDASKFAKPVAPGVNTWATKLLEAQVLAVAGKFDEAKTLGQHSLSAIRIARS